MIKRYFATKDNTITNAFQEDLATRGTGSNMGASDVLEVFSIYGQAASGSAELSRALLQFDMSHLSTDRTATTIPLSGSVSWYLKVYAAPHSKTVPRDYKLVISQVSSSWEEGYGLDMENYEDITRDGFGSNWMSASNSTAWKTPGGDYRTTGMMEQSFSTGLENIDLDVTHIVENWLDGGASGTTNYGFGIYLSSSYEAYLSNSSGTNAGAVLHNISGAVKSYYTKRFFGRETEFFFKRPTLEARWDDSRRDDRGSFYFSSSLAPAGDNLNTIYLYNYVRGRLRDIPSIGTNAIHVSLFSGSSNNTSPSGSALALSMDIGGNVGTNNTYVVTGSRVETGIYAATFAFTGSSSLTKVFDVWFSGSTTIQTAATAPIQFSTGSITPLSFNGMGATENQNYVLSMPNLRDQYRYGETPKVRLYVREKNWSPNIYTVASRTSIPSLLIQSASYQIKRAIDDEIVVPYGTGSLYHTGLSYDVTGNYFKLDTGMFDQGYQYEIYYAFYNEDTANYVEQPYKFKFRVSEE